MELHGSAKLLRIFIGEMDKIAHVPLSEVIIKEARKDGLAGATSWRGFMGFGPTSKIRSAKILDISADLPVIIEIVDVQEKIESFVRKLDQLFVEANSGGLVTLENVEVHRYFHASQGQKQEGAGS